MVVPVALSLLISRLFQPVFLERTLVWTSLPFYLALAGILPLLPARLPRLAALALAAWLSAQGAVRYDAKYRQGALGPGRGDDRPGAAAGRRRAGHAELHDAAWSTTTRRKLGMRLPTLPVPYDEATLVRYGQRARDRRRSRAAAGAHGGRARRLGDLPADRRRSAVPTTPSSTLLRASRPELRADRVYGKTCGSTASGRRQRKVQPCRDDPARPPSSTGLVAHELSGLKIASQALAVVDTVTLSYLTLGKTAQAKSVIRHINAINAKHATRQIEGPRCSHINGIVINVKPARTLVARQAGCCLDTDCILINSPCIHVC